ncbi:MAG TPA: single-stranded-DNA-specific exonuclease RecJ [Candidatus Saccharibacteria bacterium]|nr:single-stranded-DNA-specific exonuclease RecJ [Candidatus Saccharibacteria bacterium]
MTLLETILKNRGYASRQEREAFLSPDYDAQSADPFLLPDMARAVERIVRAKKNHEKVVIYGDYDIDGLTASTVLLESLTAFGIETSVFIPNRFVEGYGLSGPALKKLAADGAQLVVTVDCGSLSHKEIELANTSGLDVIVTDHHSVADTMPSAVAVINPKRTDHTYPFIDLAGVGVAFKLVQALQTELGGLAKGQEKWLLDLVALGTVCDVVQLKGENRALVYWGLRVMQKTRRVGLKMLIAVSRIQPDALDARALGFGLGPRLNAAGRLETAQLALDLLTSTDRAEALRLAELLDVMNTERRAEQDRIFKAAKEQALEYEKDNVLVVSHESWSHGIIGIVAAKLLETYHKPTFVLQELADGTAKGSARSFGDFSAVEGIRATETLLIKGGGHKLAAGVTLETSKVSDWRMAINSYYKGLKLENQSQHLYPKADVTIDGFEGLSEKLIHDLSRLEPYGHGNPEPVFTIQDVSVTGRRTMGADAQHVRYTLLDSEGYTLHMVAFNKAHEFTADIGERVNVWFSLTLNEWQGRRSVEGRLIRLELA